MRQKNFKIDSQIFCKQNQKTERPLYLKRYLSQHQLQKKTQEQMIQPKIQNQQYYSNTQRLSLQPQDIKIQKKLLPSLENKCLFKQTQNNQFKRSLSDLVRNDQDFNKIKLNSESKNGIIFNKNRVSINPFKEFNNNVLLSQQTSAFNKTESSLNQNMSKLTQPQELSENAKLEFEKYQTFKEKFSKKIIEHKQENTKEQKNINQILHTDIPKQQFLSPDISIQNQTSKFPSISIFEANNKINNGQQSRQEMIEQLLEQDQIFDIEQGIKYSKQNFVKKKKIIKQQSEDVLDKYLHKKKQEHEEYEGQLNLPMVQILQCWQESTQQIIKQGRNIAKKYDLKQIDENQQDYESENSSDDYY